MLNVAEIFRDVVRRTSEIIPEGVSRAWDGRPVTGYVADIAEVADRLTAGGKAGILLYPCIILPRDYLEVMEDGSQRIEGATVLVVAGSSNAYTSEEREERVFGPVLYPIVDALLDSLRTFGILDPYRPVQKVDRQHLQAALNEQVLPTGRAGIFNDMLDGVELRGLSLTFDCNTAKRLTKKP